MRPAALTGTIPGFHLRGALLASGAFAALVLPVGAPAARQDRVVAARNIVRWLEAGRPVIENNVVIRGDIRVPTQVKAPVTIRHSVVLGRFNASSSTFDQLVDLSGTSVHGTLDLSFARTTGPILLEGFTSRARANFDYAFFGDAAVFSSAHFDARATFAGTTFADGALLNHAAFKRTADFRYAQFRGDTQFVRSTFNARVWFAGTEFDSAADFSRSEFDGNVSFSTAHFRRSLDLSAAMFCGEKPVRFADAHFDGGATFVLAGFSAGASFLRTTAAGDMDFEGTTFDGNAWFQRSRFEAVADFRRADFSNVLNFDEAELSQLDLSGATLEAGPLVLPDPRLGPGHLDDIRMDPGEIGDVRAGNNRETRASREHALSLVESAARSAGDLSAANEAAERRLTLERQDRGSALAVLDWAIYWGVLGYLVRPLHPLFALLALILIGATVRSARRARAKRSLRGAAGGFVPDSGRSLSSLWRFRLGEGTAGEQVEATVSKVLFAALLLSLANVWPPISSLVKGVLP
jgi:uncharacterized protein YjbI with pentapeptide repeats